MKAKKYTEEQLAELNGAGMDGPKAVGHISIN